MPTRVCLIVPCYNEAARLDVERFARPPAGVTCLLVDDGSSDATLELAQRHASPALRVFALERNVGKAEAVRRGVLHARASGLLDGVEWVGYWDADLATPLSEVEYLLGYAALLGGHVDGILGSRVYKLGSRIVRSYRRHLLGRGFTTVAATVLGLGFYDSQCGAKLFRPAVIDAAFGEPFVSRWIFDVEILLRLGGYRLIECPLREWADVPSSRLHVARVAGSVLMDLLRIRRRYLTTGARHAGSS